MLKTKAGNIVNETKEIMNLIIGEFFDADAMRSMNEKEFAAMKKMFNLMETMEDYILEEAETLDKINEKLDKLLERKN